MKKDKVTLLHYWDKLTAKQLRLIHDVLRGNSSKRAGLNMGLLPFVPVDEIKLLLLRDPMSPWTEHLFNEEYANQPSWIRDFVNSRYQRSKQHDSRDYAEILEVICKEPEKPTHLAAQLDAWKAKYGGDDALRE